MQESDTIVVAIYVRRDHLHRPLSLVLKVPPLYLFEELPPPPSFF